jgi:hypothetical protein
MWIGCTNGIYYQINDDTITSNLINYKDYFDDPTRSLNINSIYHDEGSKRLFGTTSGLFMADKDNIKRNQPIQHWNGMRQSFLSINRLEDNNYIGTTTNGLVILSPDFELLSNTKKDGIISDRRIDAVVQNEDGSLLLGCQDGLYILTEDTFKRAINHKFFNHRIIDIHKQDDILIISSRGQGLSIVLPDTMIFIDESVGLISNSITSVEYVDSILYVGTKQGLSVIHLSDRYKDYKIYSYDRFHGLISNQVNDIKYWQGKLHVVFNEGLVLFEDSFLLPEEQSIPLILNNVTINGRDTSISQDLVLSYQQDQVEFSFKAISFKNKDNIYFRYYLEGLFDSWQRTNINKIKFVNLDPGLYKLKVLAYDMNGNYSKTPLYFMFKIRPPFWETWWFIMIILAITAGITFYIIRFIQKLKLNEISILEELNKREQSLRTSLKTEINKYKQLSFNKQMNPHFIYNSLNSIQSYILNNDMIKSNRYLTMFSDLMRKVLDFSNHEYISIEKDMATLKVYMELEKMRFEHKFSYNIRIKPSYVEELQIIPMLIQPFVENAIWHGLMPLDRSGNIDITLLSKGNLIKIIIEDDGVGREYSYLEKKRAVSMGTRIAERRIELLSNFYNIDIGLEIIDLHKKNEPSGTMVILYIPQISLN